MAKGGAEVGVPGPVYATHSVAHFFGRSLHPFHYTILAMSIDVNLLSMRISLSLRHKYQCRGLPVCLCGFVFVCVLCKKAFPLGHPQKHVRHVHVINQQGPTTSSFSPLPSIRALSILENATRILSVGTL